MLRHVLAAEDRDAVVICRDTPHARAAADMLEDLDFEEGGALRRTATAEFRRTDGRRIRFTGATPPIVVYGYRGHVPYVDHAVYEGPDAPGFVPDFQHVLGVLRNAVRPA